VTELLKKTGRLQDLSVAVGVVIVVVMLIIPLPTLFIDLLVAANITLALLLLLSTMYVPRALDLAAFPSLLLLTTLLRLGINVSVTRLILLHGDAGDMIHAFGTFVVGGNLIVGLVIFLILVIIQFVVVTNGAGRVAEVAARFTLDAMPGKQMAIDADLNAGQITDEQARDRRKEITREADFYGAMDGASKFVKGDAIAGLIIVAVNLLGGMAVGVLQQGLPFTEAIQHFSLLTVGDGLAAQIPALLISVATGILVTRSAGEDDLGSDITNQLSQMPRSIMLAGGAAILFGLIPGMPKIPFLTLGALMIFMAKRISDKMDNQVEEPVAEPEMSLEQQAAETARQAITVDPLELAIGIGLVGLVNPKSGGTLTQRIGAIRRQIAQELGVVIGPVRIHDEPSLESSTEYVIRVRGADVARYHLMTGYLLAIESGHTSGTVQGIATTDPAFGLPAVWIGEGQRGEADILGYTVVDPETVIVTHLTETIRKHLADILSRQDTKELLEALKQENAAAVEEVVPDALSVGDVQRVLQNLLSEGVAIRDLATILEAIGDRARMGVRDPDALAEYARQALGRALTQPYLDDTRTLRVITLHPETEASLAGALAETADGPQLAMDPTQAEQLVNQISSSQADAQAQGLRPVLLCSERLRRHLHRLLRQAAPSLPVIAYQEVAPGLRVETIAQVGS